MEEFAKKLVFFLIIAWVLFRGLLLFQNWTGDLSPSRRAEVLRHFSEEDITAGKKYVKTGFEVKVLAGYLRMGILVFLVFSGFFSNLYQKIQVFTGPGFWIPNSIFLIFYFLVEDLIMLPFSYYLGHVCETSMGFSNMTAQAWLINYLKRMMVRHTLEFIALSATFLVFRVFQRSWFLLLPSFQTFFLIATTLLFPYLITPLFYQQTPLEDGVLEDKIHKIANDVGINLSGIFVIDESKYSNHTNAYFTGLFSEKRILLCDTLIKSHTPDESALIFAHEVGHWKHDHVFKGLALGFLGMTVASFSLWYFFPILQGIKFLRLGPLFSAENIPVLMVFLTVFNVFLSPVEAQISQYFERQADYKSLELTGDWKTFIEAEKRLALDNKSDLLPHPFRVFWLYSHPPAIDRIKMAEKFAELTISGNEPE